MMLKRASIAVLVLVAAVFLYIGYSSYDAGRSSASAAVQAAGRSKAADGPISTSATDATTGATPLTATPTTAATEVTASGAATAPDGAGAPATDTIKPNPPNGMTFGGSGHYQLYRQGNLTWRLNTDTGQSCIVFATEDEWRKPQVYRDGCKTKGQV